MFGRRYQVALDVQPDLFISSYGREPMRRLVHDWLQAQFLLNVSGLHSNVVAMASIPATSLFATTAPVAEVERSAISLAFAAGYASVSAWCASPGGCLRLRLPQLAHLA